MEPVGRQKRGRWPGSQQQAGTGRRGGKNAHLTLQFMAQCRHCEACAAKCSFTEPDSVHASQAARKRCRGGPRYAGMMALSCTCRTGGYGGTDRASCYARYKQDLECINHLTSCTVSQKRKPARRRARQAHLLQQPLELGGQCCGGGGSGALADVILEDILPALAGQSISEFTISSIRVSRRSQGRYDPFLVNWRRTLHPAAAPGQAEQQHAARGKLKTQGPFPLTRTHPTAPE